MLELQCEPLRSEAVQFLEGGEVFELENLMGFLAALKFGSCTERLVEGGHGIIHLKTSSSRYRGEAYDSLALRFPAYSHMLTTDDSVFVRMAKLLAGARNPRAMLEQLGLQRHPEFAKAKGSWSPRFQIIVYRTDNWSRYRQQLHIDKDNKPPTVHPAPTEKLPTADGVYELIKQQAGVAHFVHWVHGKAGGFAKLFFSCKAPLAAVKTLMALLSPSGFSPLQGMRTLWDSDVAEAALGEEALDKLTHQGASSTLWLSIVSNNPSQAKRAIAGDLASSDVGIAVHKLMGVDKASQEVVATSAPVNITGQIEAELNLPCVALVLRPEALSLKSLETIRVWAAVLAVLHRWDPGQVPRAVVEKSSAETWEHLTRLCSSPCAELALQASRLAEDDCAVLPHCCKAGLMDRRLVGDTAVFALTEAGKAAVLACKTLHSPQRVLSDINPCVQERDLYELLEGMEQDGWAHKVVCASKDITDACSSPYTGGGATILYLKARTTARSIKKYYLCALRLAGEGATVPHFAERETYKKLLDPEWAPRKRQRKATMTV